MTELLHATGIRLGLITNGEQWMLVDAPRDDTAGFTSWYAELWLEERLTLRAFRSLLGARRFFGVAANDTLDALLAESAENQQEVTDQLGYPVRRAVVVLVDALDRADQDRGRKLLAGVPEAEIYEAALTVMMRLVFLFCAEERDLLLLGDPLFDQHYAASPLREQLRQAADQHGEEILERRYDAWSRLLATFRAVHGGVRHERMTIPPYGGRLFDPDRFPFLEGRTHGTAWRASAADPLPVSNRTVLHLLEALQLLQVKAPGGGPVEARRLSFRALDIEQVGHVYEGLLDHTAKRATEVTLSLAGSRDKTRDFEPEVPLSQLEALATRDRPALIDYLTEETHRSSTAIEKQLNRPPTPEDEQRLQVACGGGAEGRALLERMRPFAGLVRVDSFGHPMVIHGGSVYVTEGTDRRATGTQYTPRSLTEPIVQHALEPLVYEGPAEGKPRVEWNLRSPQELLALAICDFACGSGAFLVQACRYLAARLLEAWEAIERQHPCLVRITPEGELSQGLPEERLIPKDPDERLTYAMRLVAQRCLYGVDVNPLAVEMAKLSMWLLTLAKERPFTFLDHSIRCGDSLLGITSLDQLKRFSLAEGPVQRTISQQVSFDDLIDRAVAARLRIESMDGDTIEHVAAQKELLREAEEQLGRLKGAADQLVAAEIGDGSREDAIRMANLILLPHDSAGTRIDAVPPRSSRRPFHWPLEFPEVVVARGGFSAFVGNPPFMGGRLIGRSLGMDYQNYLRLVRENVKGSPDLCGYFFLRGFRLCKDNGVLGLIATKSIAETGSRVVSLDRIISKGGTIFRALSRMPWPGTAAVVVACLWIVRGRWLSPRQLDHHEVSEINGGLTPVDLAGRPHRLKALAGRYSQGQDTMGRGFELAEDEVDDLIGRNPKLRDVIFPLFNGQDLNTMAELKPYRWVIYFRDWPEHRAREYPEAFQRVHDLVKPYRDSLTGQIHQRCFWKFWDLRPRLMKEVEEHDFLLASPIVTKYLTFRRVPSSNIYNMKTKLYFLYDWWHFGLLQSSFHQDWATWLCGTIGEKGLNYSTSDALETWPFPDVRASAEALKELGRLGDAYHRFREDLMHELEEGPTRLYNRFHDPDEQLPAVIACRQLHQQLDQAVAAAYGWPDLEVQHGFEETKLGLRFTVTETIRAEARRRLVALNHERYSAELRQGLHTKGSASKSGAGKKKRADEVADLFS